MFEPGFIQYSDFLMEISAYLIR